jgi:hypothetical protein
MLVVCVGRVGAQWDDHVVQPAAKRVELQRSMVDPPAALLGPVDQVPTGAGLGWRTTIAYPSGRMLTDTHLDRDGWGFIIGVLSNSWHTRAVDALDRILETWRWISPDEPVPPEIP